VKTAFDFYKSHFFDYDEEYNNSQPNPLQKMQRRDRERDGPRFPFLLLWRVRR